MTQLDPIIDALYLDIDGLNLSNDATTPNTVLNISAGQARDSNNVMDMLLGNWLNQGLPSVTANSATSLNLAVTGANGLDQGVLVLSSNYYVYIIGDSSNKKPTATIASLSATAPLLPFGYDSIRLLGFIQTDASVHVLPFNSSINGNARYLQYSTPVAVTVTASGTSATYSAMDLSPGVPVSNYGAVTLQYKWTPNAAGDILNFTPSGATGDAITIYGLVAAVAQSGSFIIYPNTVSGVPKVSYKVSAGTLNNVWVLALNAGR